MIRDEELKALAKEKFSYFRILEKKHQELDASYKKVQGNK
jgi:hypothetical protein